VVLNGFVPYCEETDNGILDSWGDDCIVGYTNLINSGTDPNYLCTYYDTTDFFSDVMCCACGGGNTVTVDAMIEGYLNSGNNLQKPGGSSDYWGAMIFKIPDDAEVPSTITRTLDSTGLSPEVSISFTFNIVDCTSIIAQSAPVNLATLEDFKTYASCLGVIELEVNSAGKYSQAVNTGDYVKVLFK